MAATSGPAIADAPIAVVPPFSAVAMTPTAVPVPGKPFTLETEELAPIAVELSENAVAFAPIAVELEPLAKEDEQKAVPNGFAAT